jgi:hypothetical protein
VTAPGAVAVVPEDAAALEVVALLPLVALLLDPVPPELDPDCVELFPNGTGVPFVPLVGTAVNPAAPADPEVAVPLTSSA